MPLTQSATGRFGRAQVSGVEIGISRWTAKLRKEYADATDSNGYDTVTQQLWTYQSPGVVGADGTLEGYYDMGGSTDSNFTQIFRSDGPYTVSYYFTRTLLFATWAVDFTDVEYAVSIPGATMISFTANWKSHGIPTSLP